MALNEDKPRNATVKAYNGQVELLRIDREEYALAKEHMIREHNKKMAFLSGTSVFGHLPPEALHTVAKQMFFQRYGLMAEIWKQGSAVDPTRFMPVVSRGEVRIIQTIPLSSRRLQQQVAESIPKGRPHAEPRATVEPASDEGREDELNDKVFVLGTLCRRALLVESTMLERPAPSAEPTYKRGSSSAAASLATRACTLFGRYPVELLWISRFFFDQLLAEHAHLRPYFEEWVFPFPDATHAHRLFAEHGMWRRFKRQLRVDVQHHSPRMQQRIARARDAAGAKRSPLPLASPVLRYLQPDLELPCRLPAEIDLLRQPQFQAQGPPAGSLATRFDTTPRAEVYSRFPWEPHHANVPKPVATVLLQAQATAVRSPRPTEPGKVSSPRSPSCANTARAKAKAGPTPTPPPRRARVPTASPIARRRPLRLSQAK